MLLFYCILLLGNVQGQGFEQRTPLPSGCLKPVEIPAGHVHGFYVTLNRSKMAYTFLPASTISLGDVYASNPHVELLLGVGKSYPFAHTFNPRLWNGAVRYTALSSSDAPTKSPVVMTLTSSPVSVSVDNGDNGSEDNYNTGVISTANGNELMTTFQDTSGQCGNMFDVVALKDITVIEMDIHAIDTNQTIEVFVREGTFQGAEQEPSRWTKSGSVQIVGKGQGVPTPLPAGSFEPIFIRNGNSMGFYVTSTKPEIRYSEG